MARMLAAFGANIGILGLFLPVARVVDQRVRGGQPYDVRIWGGFASTTDPTQQLGYVLLGFFVVLALFGLWVMGSRFSRAKAAGVLLFALPAEALAIYVLAFHLRALPGDVALGPGLLLMVGGAGMAVLAGLIALLWPERPPRPAPAG